MSDAEKKIMNDFCSDVSCLGVVVTTPSGGGVSTVSERKSTSL